MTIQRLSLKLLSFIAILTVVGIGHVSGQKLPDVRTDQDVVSDESQFIEAIQLRLKGDYDKAESKLKMLIDRHKKEAVYEYELARTYHQAREVEEAKKRIKIAIAKDESNLWYWQYLVNLIEESSGSDEELIDIYSSMYELEPDRHTYLENIAFHQLKKGDWQEAIKSLSRYEEKTGLHFETTRQKHLIYEAQGDEKSAVAELDRFIQKNPKNIQILEFAGKYSIDIEDTKLARKYYKAILEIEPRHAEARLALSKLGDLTQTQNEGLANFINDPTLSMDDKVKLFIPLLTQYREDTSSISINEIEVMALSIKDQYGENDKTTALLGDVYSMQNKLKKSAEEYKSSIEINDNNFQVWVQLMHVLADDSSMNELEKYSEDAIDLYPNHPLPYAFLALASLYNGQEKRSDEMIEEARLRCGANKNLMKEVEAIMVRTKNKRVE